jgi:hypothetical protein
LNKLRTSTVITDAKIAKDAGIAGFFTCNCIYELIEK